MTTQASGLIEKGQWCVYLIECKNGAFYAGITNHLEKRYAQHACGKGAKYTRANPPVRLLGARAYPNRSSASQAEYAIKQLPKTKKITFLQSGAISDVTCANQ